MLDFKYMKCSDIDVSSNDNYTPINSSLLALLHEKSLLDKQYVILNVIIFLLIFFINKIYYIQDREECTGQIEGYM